MPARPSGKPGVVWNSITQRWEVVSKGGRLELAIDRQGRIPVQFISFIGSMAAVNGSVGVLPVVGTITNANGLAVGDMVFVTLGSAYTTGNIFAPRIPTANTLNVQVWGSMPAAGVNVFAIRTATG